MLPAAESYARHVLADLAGAASVRPRRIASANLDLGLALVAADKPEEAAHVALAAIESGRLVPSNYWRVAEVVTGIENRDATDAATVREAFRDTYPGLGRSRCRGIGSVHGDITCALPLLVALSTCGPEREAGPG
ncbi:hypothetical protein OHA40_06755 [Nocardia sp. NBC_00508]|uniref:hypothetical protein n=1 Tax=Nocardia sp. NBC_00508 TaxID=2975992 RepID=UPI002E81CF9F|nr:hypothetical protein [Nocardia sp. NBC_00508]WUD67823.1 hypothetical protein OHA40_06755 [Nocardia sp. NBC_00508]